MVVDSGNGVKDWYGWCVRRAAGVPRAESHVVRAWEACTMVGEIIDLLFRICRGREARDKVGL